MAKKRTKKTAAVRKNTLASRQDLDGWTYQYLRNGWYRIFDSEGKPIITIHGDADLTALVLQAPSLFRMGEELANNIPTDYSPEGEGYDEEGRMVQEHRMEVLRGFSEALEAAQVAIDRR